MGVSYELHRYFKNEEGTLWDFDRVRYYSDPAGGRGYVEYVQAIGYDADPSYPEGLWFRATPAADAMLTRVLAGVALAASASSPARIAPPMPTGWTLPLTLTLAGLLALGGLLFQLRPRPARA